MLSQGKLSFREKFAKIEIEGTFGENLLVLMNE